MTISFDTFMATEPGTLHIRICVPELDQIYSALWSGLVDRNRTESCAKCHCDVAYDPLSTMREDREVIICTRCLMPTIRLRRRDWGVVHPYLDAHVTARTQHELRRQGVSLPTGFVRAEVLV